MTLDEEYFPRGGKPKSTQKEGTRGIVKKKNDNLFKDSAITKKKKRLKKKKVETKDLEIDPVNKKSKKNAEKEKTAQLSIEPLTYKMLREGMNVLCRVLDVKEMDLTVSLPGRISATIPITEISDPYTKLLNRLAQDEDVDAKSLKEMFSVGQIFPCSIKEASDESSNKIIASFNPSDVNKEIPVSALSKGLMLAAAVQSIEDHGYVLDVGLPDVRCFMPKKKGSDDKDGEEELAVGQVVQANVIQCQVDGTVATLTLSLKRTVKIKQNVELNVSTLTPGTNVHVNVTKVTPRGVVVSFGNLMGYIYKDHLVNGSDQLSSYSNKSKQLTALVLYTLPLVNAVYLSLKSSLVTPKEEEPMKYSIGRIFDSATIIEVSNAGVLVQLDSEGSKGFIPLRHLSDDRDAIENVQSHFALKSRRRCRVLQYASMDEVFICTFKKSLLNQKALRYEDYTVGELVEGRVESVTPAGISLVLGQNLKGFVPKLHWADDPRLKKPELRFKIGSTLKCRVLRIQLDRRQLHLTCKPSLVDGTENPICSDVGQLEKKLRLKGVVSLIQSGGVLVSFYGNLTGWIPRIRLQQKGIADIGRYFFPGQVISCIVDNVQSDSGKVTLDLDKPTTAAPSAPKKATAALGSIVQCRVVKIQLESDGGNGLGIEVSLTGSRAKGWIPIEHLSDFPRLCPALLRLYRVGDVIPEAILCSVSELQTIVSLKSSLIKFAKTENFPASLAEIQVNSVFPCLFSRKRDFGVFAKLFCPPGQFEVMFPKSKIPESLRSAIEEAAGGQSSTVMEGKVLSVDVENKKVSLSALVTDVTSHPADVLATYLKQVDRIRQRYLDGSDAGLKYLAGLKCGDTVIGKLSRSFEDAASDLEFDLPNGVKGVVPAFHHAKKPFNANDMIAGLVLYADLVDRIVYITTRDTIVSELTGETAERDRPAAPTADGHRRGKVILNTDYLSLLLVAGSVVFSPNVRNWNEVSHLPKAPYAVGSDVKLEAVDRSDHPIAPYFRYPDEKKTKGSRKRQRQISEASTQSTGVKATSKKQKTTPTPDAAAAAPAAITAKTDASTAPASIAANATNSASGSGAGKAAREAITQQVVDRKRLELPRLQVASSFFWDDDDEATPKLMALRPSTADSSDSDDSEDSDDGENKGASQEKLSSKDRRERARQKLERMREEEKKLSAVELTLTDGDRAPTSADDFDRLLLASPNSSILWLQYMAFHLENADVDKARAVAQKALKTISFREEQEKFNVWIAWLNLEHMYGTTEVYEETFQEALRCNDPLKIHRQMALNFEQSGQFEQAENLYNVMQKKFGKHDRSVWLNSCAFYVKNSKLDTARNVFQKALTCLPKKDHIELISRFGQLEVKFGELERGKTMFDTLMMSYPKRTDLWLVYIDTLTKAGHLESARQVLERTITLQLPAKKMKTLFQKFLEFETAHGDQDRLDYVRRKALEYVESKSAVADE